MARKVSDYALEHALGAREAIAALGEARRHDPSALAVLLESLAKERPPKWVAFSWALGFTIVFRELGALGHNMRGGVDGLPQPEINAGFRQANKLKRLAEIKGAGAAYASLRRLAREWGSLTRPDPRRDAVLLQVALALAPPPVPPGPGMGPGKRPAFSMWMS